MKSQTQSYSGLSCASLANDIPYNNNQQPPQQQMNSGNITDSPDTVTTDVSESKLNPEVAAFNPLGQVTMNLFAKLQNINTEMQNIKYQLDMILTPTLNQLNQQIAGYQLNPILLQLPQYELNYYQIQQQQISIAQQINIHQFRYKELEQTLKVTQEMYHKNQYQQYTLTQPQQYNVDNELIDDHAEIDDDDEKDEQQEQQEQHEEYTGDGTSDEPQKNIMRYSINELIGFQSQFLSINFRNHQNIPLNIRFVSHGINNEKYMKNVVKMIEFKQHSYIIKVPKDTKEKLTKTLRGVLNKMTDTNFIKISQRTMDIVDEFASSADIMEIIIGLILSFGIKQPEFSNQFAALCIHLENNTQYHSIFRKMVITQMNALFIQHRQHSSPDKPVIDKNMDPEMVELRKSKKKDNFIAIMELIGELYNVTLIKRSVVYKGVFDVLLPPQNKELSKIDLEGLCRLFKRCGPLLDEEGPKFVDKYMQKMQSHAKKFDFRTKCIVEQVKTMRDNGWKHR